MKLNKQGCITKTNCRVNITFTIIKLASLQGITLEDFVRLNHYNQQVLGSYEYLTEFTWLR
jgi:hypothetical protein